MSRSILLGLGLAVGAAAAFAGALYADSLWADIALGAVGVVFAATAAFRIRSDLPGTRSGELGRFTRTFRGF